MEDVAFRGSGGVKMNEEEAKTYIETVSKNTDISSSHQAARSTQAS